MSRSMVPRRLRDERGSATAELAAGLPSLVLLLLFALGAVEAGWSQTECLDAARDAALAAARGGDGVAAGQHEAPAGAVVAVTVDGEFVRASVRVRVNPLGPHLPGVVVNGSAMAALEPGEIP